MSSLNSDKILTNKNQKASQLKENPSMKINMDGTGDTSSNEPKSPMTKKIKITESGDSNETMYTTCVAIDETIDGTIDYTAAESSLDSTVAESTLHGSITNSSLDETLAQTTDTSEVRELTLNSTIDQKNIEDLLDESLEELINPKALNKDSNSAFIPIFKESDLAALYNYNTTAYFSLDSSSSESDIPEYLTDLRCPSYKKKRRTFEDDWNWKMFKEYRESQAYRSDTSSSFIKEESKVDESYLKDSSVAVATDTNNQSNSEELGQLMSNLKISRDTELLDEKERSFEKVNQIQKNTSFEYGPDVATTNLLIMASQSLETHAEVEEMYAKREERARSIVRRRYNVTLEEFFNTVASGIDKKEGLDRYEMFLEALDTTAMQKEKLGKITKNLDEFNKFPILTDLKHPFKSRKEKRAYFLKTSFAALYLNAIKAKKVLKQHRGYASV